MENIMTKEEKIERFKKMNENIIPGQIVCAGSSLMEMFPVEELAKEAKLNAIIYNRGVGGFVTDEYRYLYSGFKAVKVVHQYRNKRPQQSGYTNRRNDRKL